MKIELTRGVVAGRRTFPNVIVGIKLIVENEEDKGIFDALHQDSWQDEDDEYIVYEVEEEQTGTMLLLRKTIL